MIAANDKAPKEATGLVVEFSSPNKGKANGQNNYLTWAGEMHTTMGARYGPMARVFTDHREAETRRKCLRRPHQSKLPNSQK